MRNKTLKLISYSLLALMTLTLSACQQTDVIANFSIKSFNDISATIPDNFVKDDTDGFIVFSPDKTESFSFGKNLSIILDSEAFVNAGLDITKLSSDIEAKDGTLVIQTKNTNYSDDEENIKLAFDKLIREDRDSLEYHIDHDIFELRLKDGNSFRWAKDITTNERDIVFVLNPTPFIEAGLDTNKLSDWKFTKVKIMDNGKTIEVDKLLRIYNIN